MRNGESERGETRIPNKKIITHSSGSVISFEIRRTLRRLQIADKIKIIHVNIHIIIIIIIWRCGVNRNKSIA